MKSHNNQNNETESEMFTETGGSNNETSLKVFRYIGGNPAPNIIFLDISNHAGNIGNIHPLALGQKPVNKQ